jgi:hypothetical protein
MTDGVVWFLTQAGDFLTYHGDQFMYTWVMLNVKVITPERQLVGWYMVAEYSFQHP